MKVHGNVFAFFGVLVGSVVGSAQALRYEAYATPQPCEAQMRYTQPLAIARSNQRPNDVSHLKVLLDQNYNIIAFGNDFTRNGQRLHEVYCLDQLARGVVTTRSDSTFYTGDVTRIRVPGFAAGANRITLVFDYFFDFFATGSDRWRHKNIAIERRGDAWVVLNERNQPVREIFLSATSTGIKNVGLRP